MRSVLAYTASRLLLFAVAWGLIYLLGARGLLALALAFGISGVASYILLSAQRDAMSSAIVTGMERMRGVRERLDEGAAAEDAAPGSGQSDGSDGNAARDTSEEPR
ncbi:uncharacterized protein DUF4229 [Haloactinospora alba]|uniref:Uncharacterized protein DUF4229 n=1 Tax=Haloactinospora alba TaxID=405555 RepID=A0A543NMQ2_9ACTN|nr:DUF4229 domain-containing protein [Haloactinospora alba]TQN33115.1 uncharacterized protein DUF4229 [Haloactinospora alba]